MKANQIFLLLIFLIYGCQSSKSLEPNGEIIGNDKFTFASDSTDLFFPLETFRDTSLFVGYDTLVVNWYSKHLFAMEEPILFANEDDLEIFRFTWLRTFHNPIAIRIQKSNNQFQVVWKVCDGAGGYEPGSLVTHKKKVLSKREWNEFIKLIESSNFWNLPTNEKEIIGHDGSQWIIEGTTKKGYHVIDRWTPGEKAPVYKLGNYLLSLTDIKIEENNKY